MKPAEPKQPSPRAPAASSQRKVLVIDDSLMLLSFVKEILSEANYQVSTAPTAEEGLAQAANDPPDLILLDYVLPDMKGDDVCQRLSDNAATAKVSIIYMSGFGTDLQPDQIKSANVIGSLNKPFTSDLLIKTVENLMPKDTSEPAQPESQTMEAEPPPSTPEAAWQEPQPVAKEESPGPRQPWQDQEPVAKDEPAWTEPAWTGARTKDEPAWTAWKELSRVENARNRNLSPPPRMQVNLPGRK